jgi:DNA-binding transcriptional LysR family regulator
MLPCNFNHLYYFYRVAAHKSVSKASKELLIAQSALSTQLKQLEESFNTTLFNRTKGGMTLTETGEIVFRYAMSMFETFEQMKRELVLAEKEVRGPLRLGSVNSVGIYFLPEVLTAFHRKFPDVEVEMEMHTSSRVMELLQENLVDLALIAWDRQYPQLDSAVIMQDALLLVAHPEHPLTRKRNPSLSDLSEHRFVGYEPGTPTRILIDAHFKGLGVSLDYVLSLSNIATIKHMAVAGMGLTFLPRLAVELEIKERILRAVNIPEAQIERPVTLYWKSRRVLSRPAEEFRTFLKAWVARPAAEAVRA